MLLHRQSEPAKVGLNRNAATWKGISYCRMQGLDIADLTDCLNSCRKVGSIVGKNRSVRADLG